MKISVHPLAERDITDAFRFYRREAGVGVALRFVAEVERVITLLRRHPQIGSPSGSLPDAQRRAYRLTGFPYTVIYRPVPDGLRLLVVRHQGRDPSYGDDRG